MTDKEKEREITPKEVAHVTGTRFPKDIYFRTNKELIAKYPFIMPDGFLISIPIYEGESVQGKLNSYIVNWYKVANKHFEKFDHFNIKSKCPRCGGPMRCRIVDNQAMIWCLDYKCGYQIVEKDIKDGKRLIEKVDLKHRQISKTNS